MCATPALEELTFLESHNFSGITQLFWNHTTFLESHNFSGITQLFWNHTTFLEELCPGLKLAPRYPAAFLKISPNRSATICSSPSCSVRTDIRIPLSPFPVTRRLRLGG